MHGAHLSVGTYSRVAYWGHLMTPLFDFFLTNYNMILHFDPTLNYMLTPHNQSNKLEVKQCHISKLIFSVKKKVN